MPPPENQGGLQQNTALISAVLSYPFLEPWQQAWTRIAKSIEALTSPHLRRFDLHFFIVVDPRYMSLDDAFAEVSQIKDRIPINEFLSRPSLRLLEEVGVHEHWQVSESVALSEVERLQHAIDTFLKGLNWHSRGILKTSHVTHVFPSIPPAEPSSDSALL